MIDEATMTTKRGTVKHLRDKRFGFIVSSDGTEYFFQKSACVATASMDCVKAGGHVRGA